MAARSAQIQVQPYVSGWCETASHHRCKGNYAGTACCCPCHRLAPTAGAAGAS